MRTNGLIAFALTVATATFAPADVLWDNNIETNGSNARAVSPPGFPQIRVADDFVVPKNGWEIQLVRYAALEDATWSWSNGDGIVVFVYADEAGPGELVATREVGGSKIATGESYFGRKEYRYLAEFGDEPIVLSVGTYWIGIRHPNAGGSGTNYWLTSDGGPDGGESSPGYFSLDSGGFWIFEGDIWHHAFVIADLSGSCDPCDANCDGSVDLTDVEPFIGLLFGDEPCASCSGDTNGDGSVDLTDVEGFIGCLLG